MQQAAQAPFTLTIRKNFTSGKPITFSGRRAHVLAGEILESVALLNGSVKEEKKEIFRSLGAVIKSGEELVAAKPGERETAAAKCKHDLRALWEADHVLASKLKRESIGNGLPVKAAQQLIIDEHLPILLSTIQSLGNLFLDAVSKNDGALAGKWLRTIKNGAERIDALSNLLDSLTKDSIWEIKALAEHVCTRAALHLAGVEIGLDARKAERLRESAAFFEMLARKLNTAEGAGLVSLLVEVAMACEDKAKLAENGARYSREIREKIEAIKCTIEPERRELASQPVDDPRRMALNVFEHHLVSPTVGMITLLPLAAKNPAAASKSAAAGTANALRFLEIAMRVRKTDDPRTLALVFTSGDTSAYLEKLEGKYTS